MEVEDEEQLEEELEQAADRLEEEEWLRRRRDAEKRKGQMIDKWLQDATTGHPDMLERYEHSRRASFRPTHMKRLMVDKLGLAVDDDMVIVMRGIAKVFVAEVIEEAAQLRNAEAPGIPVGPVHIRRALADLHTRPKARKPLRYRRRIFWR